MILHLLAIAPAALGLCCLAADRRRARALELGAAILMVIAMADAAVTGFVPVAWWAVLLLSGAVLLSAVRGRARRRVPVGAAVGAGAVAHPGGAAGAADWMGDVPMAAHSAAGMVVMAALMLAMSGAGASTASHHHAATPSLAAAALLIGAAYLVASMVLAMRARPRLDRIQYAAMAASVALMALSLGA